MRRRPGDDYVTRPRHEAAGHTWTRAQTMPSRSNESVGGPDALLSVHNALSFNCPCTTPSASTSHGVRPARRLRGLIVGSDRNHRHGREWAFDRMQLLRRHRLGHALFSVLVRREGCRSWRGVMRPPRGARHGECRVPRGAVRPLPSPMRGRRLAPARLGMAAAERRDIAVAVDVAAGRAVPRRRTIAHRVSRAAGSGSRATRT